jgi:regulator of replication initiation timing
MTTEVILGIIATATTAIAGWWKFNELRLQKESDAKSHEIDTAHNNTQFVVSSMLGRVEKLELRHDELQDTVRKVGKEASDERERLIKLYEDKLETLRQEMRQLNMDNSNELGAWKDKYYALMQEYHKLKLEHEDLQKRFSALEAEARHMRDMFQRRRKTDTLRDIVETEDVTD